MGEYAFVSGWYNCLNKQAADDLVTLFRENGWIKSEQTGISEQDFRHKESDTIITIPRQKYRNLWRYTNDIGRRYAIRYHIVSANETTFVGYIDTHKSKRSEQDLSEWADNVDVPTSRPTHVTDANREQYRQWKLRVTQLFLETHNASPKPSTQ